MIDLEYLLLYLKSVKTLHCFEFSICVLFQQVERLKLKGKPPRLLSLRELSSNPLPCLNIRSNINLLRKSRSMLRMQIPIRFRNL